MLIATFCACLLTALYLEPRVACLSAILHGRGHLVFSITTVCGALVLAMLWTTQVTLHHRDAVEDLLTQLTNSMDVLLSDALTDSIEMVKAAHTTWKFTGKYRQSIDRQ